ncbi:MULTISPECIES: murein biosynthesis integral membrane protein MurJ [unclassified Modestobacter]|uniref:murein biosynthesis integral membrane protein MurJ n=1 Tax=unclassified Modestobacter TaxID=2643866 RepID=UPI0022AB2EA2|nr:MULTISPECIES: murein biosynthesis integral membrane protein MurJ [unclassified Modestobacter]MCZ2823002.1 murein biosynthesis integral membrane protein MurJ [Modestobacter sp. VKM Ac-2981]MCZ2851248.1 murein biosynthesis integral membrane protein MurJ [Modestobacter sp. VKM Ac-2982]
MGDPASGDGARRRAALPPVPPPARPRRFVPGPDDTQLIPVIPAVPRYLEDEPEDTDVRQGRSGGSSGILRAAGTMAVASLVSRLTGFLRTVVLTAALGFGLVGNAYTVANTLPNIVYELLLGGVLTSVVVPLLVTAQERDADGGVRYTQRLLTLATVGLAVLTVVAVLAAPALTWLMGIREDPGQVELANWLARILLVEIVFYGIGALATAVLNSRQVFGPPAWAPVLNNVVVIATGAVFLLAAGPGDLTPVTITAFQVWLLGIGTTLGIAVQAFVLLPLLGRNGVPLRPRWGLRGTGLAEAGTLGLWVIGYVLVSQVGVVVASIVANEAADAGGLGPMAFANASLLFQMPYGIIGVALLTALLPRMSRAAARHDMDGVVADLSLGTRLSATGLLPVTALLVVLGPAVGIVAFARGNADVTDARQVGVALAVGAFGLLPMAVTLLQLRVFYAMKDARTPTLIQVAMVAVRVPLLLLVPVLVDPERVVAGLMIATSATYVAGWVVGAIALDRKLGVRASAEAGTTVLRMGAVSAVAGALGWAAVSLAGRSLGTSVPGSLGTVVLGTVVIGSAVVAGAVMAGVPELRGVLAGVRARLGRSR